MLATFRLLLLPPVGQSHTEHPSMSRSPCERRARLHRKGPQDQCCVPYKERRELQRMALAVQPVTPQFPQSPLPGFQIRTYRDVHCLLRLSHCGAESNIMGISKTWSLRSGLCANRSMSFNERTLPGGRGELSEP